MSDKQVKQFKERPILFSTEMVQAILKGTKTQTRRVIKVQPPDDRYQISTLSETTDRSRKKLEGQHHWVIYDHEKFRIVEDQDKHFKSPFGYVGDRLWVRETFMAWYREGVFSHVAAYKADGYQAEQDERWTPSIHMPRKASRINLEITNIKVERMQDGGDREFWGEDKWKVNPWVWVIEFKKLGL